MKRQTEAKRLRAKLHSVRAELRRRWHHSTREQGAWLQSVVRGHFASYAVPTNIYALHSFRTVIARHWYHALRRRSQWDRTTWSRLLPLVDRWLPRPHILHPWPNQRFDVTTQGKSRMR